MIFVESAAFAQKSIQKAYTALYVQKALPVALSYSPNPLQVVEHDGSITIIPRDFYFSNVGFFCKKEVQIEKRLGLPVRFRLGSVDACNFLEGKRRYAGIK